MAFHIKDGYVENPAICYFVDDATATRGIVFQPDVYTFAEWVAETAGITRVIDVGCGWADKLAGIHDRHPGWHYEGIDFGSNIQHCRQTHDWMVIHDTDIEQPFTIFGEGAIVICSDVIEHVADPTALVIALKESKAAAIIVSTPERDVQYGADHVGPPQNPCHIREWNWAELASYLTEAGLTVRHPSLTRGNDRGTAMATQLLLCTP
jgi:hypothetical protein